MKLLMKTTWHMKIKYKVIFVFLSLYSFLHLANAEMKNNFSDKNKLKNSNELISFQNSEKHEYTLKWCMKFQQIREQYVGKFIKEMEDTNFPVDEYFTRKECQPERYSEVVKSPLTHYIAEAPVTRQDFLLRIWNYYFFKRKSPEVFPAIVNAVNTKGETLLDYMESLRLRNINTDDEQQDSIRKIISFACSHGGVYLYHKNKKCQ